MAAALYSLIASFIIVKFIDAISSRGADEDTESGGLDLAELGEAGYGL